MSIVAVTPLSISMLASEVKGAAWLENWQRAIAVYELDAGCRAAEIHPVHRIRCDFHRRIEVQRAGIDLSAACESVRAAEAQHATPHFIERQCAHGAAGRIREHAGKCGGTCVVVADGQRSRGAAVVRDVAGPSERADALAIAVQGKCGPAAHRQGRRRRDDISGSGDQRAIADCRGAGIRLCAAELQCSGAG